MDSGFDVNAMVSNPTPLASLQARGLLLPPNDGPDHHARRIRFLEMNHLHQPEDLAVNTDRNDPVYQGLPFSD